jgi:hypothetical protein
MRLPAKTLMDYCPYLINYYKISVIATVNGSVLTATKFSAL